MSTEHHNLPACNGQTSITITSRIAVVCATLVILSAGILGYTALYDLFVSIGLFAAWLGIFFPLLFDLAEVTAAVSVFNAKLQGEDDRFAWGMVLLFTVLGVVANIAHAAFAWYIGKITPVQLDLAIFATSLFPLSVALVTHLVKRVIARDITRHSILSSLAELADQLDQKRRELAELFTTKQGELDRLNGQINQARAKLEQLKSDIQAGKVQQNARSVNELNAARQAKIDQRRASVVLLLEKELTPAEIAQQLNVKVRTIKRDIVALNGKAETTLQPAPDNAEGSAFDRIVSTARADGRDDIADILTTAKRGWDKVNGQVAE